VIDELQKEQARPIEIVVDEPGEGVNAPVAENDEMAQKKRA